MCINKAEILDRLCYTELVYGRINKKLGTELTKSEIEKMISETVNETAERLFVRTGKNIYVTNPERGIRVTINSNTYRVITADKS